MNVSRPARQARAVVAGLAAAATLTGLVQGAAPAFAAAAKPRPLPAAAATATPAPPVRVANPDSTLGKGWNTSKDRAVTGAADASGFKILTADAGKAYTWKTVAVLAEPGLSADSWIGNTCVMDRDHAAAVYAPRAFTNKPDLMQGGAFAAVVNLRTGRVAKLPFTATLAYFDPSCNTATHQAVFTAFRDMNDPAHMKTRLVTVDRTGRSTSDTALAGEVTSAVPVKDGTVAARGRSLIRIDHSGRLKTLAATDNVPFDIRPTAAGRIALVDRTGDSTASAKIWDGRSRPSLIARGRLGDLELQQGDHGKVFLTGHPAGTPKTTGTGVTRLNAPADADISTLGRLAIGQVITPGIRRGLSRVKDAGKDFDKHDAASPAQENAAPTPETVNSDQPTTVTSTATSTGKRITQTVADTTAESGNGTFSPALTGRRTPAATLRAGAVSHDPTDPDRWCSVPRNDVKSLALQPTPNQVEWAVDMAVRGELHAQWLTQGGWRNASGLSTVDPQGLFSRPSLTGGGRIPANVLLGVMAQESNLWQAEPGSIPGQMGNPLAAYDGFYGHKTVEGDPASHWTIHWDLSDCGYGVGQVTDGMRLAGHEKPNEKALPAATQRAVALDYTVNIAASMYILADKWNEIHEPGQTLTLNNDDAAKPENWFAALWNYNSGMNSRSDAGTNGNWGLGWYNNPANPSYKPDRKPFLDSKLDPDGWAKDPAHPQDWPYEEKVLGWAAWSIDTGYSYATSGRQDWPGESGYATAGFQPAWWTSDQARSELKPPLDTFCNSHNNCDAANPPQCPDAACYARYWWHETNATWKNCAAPANACGNESIKYATLRAEPGRGTRLQTGSPVCTTTGATGIPSTSLIVNSMPDSTNTYSDCGTTGTDAGSFQFTFYADPNATGPGLGQYDAKADLHQVGGGYNGHFWFAHTRDAAHLGGDSGRMTVKGTWTLEQSVSWARVFVHLPDTGAQTRQAAYVIGGSDSTSPQRIVEQRANRWVSLGAFHFTGTPSVTLANATDDGTADEDVAWDAVAFQPLSGKPNHVVVAMGDSYSSGEGASEGNRDYYPETNYRNKDVRDACHRSRQAWSRQATIPGETSPTADLNDSWSSRMDYHLIACSGARTYNVLGVPQDNGGEVPQINQGYLDANTTLVTISIGGNDARFSGIVQKCLISFGVGDCGDKTFDSGDPDSKVGGRDQKFVGQTLKTAVPGIINEIVRPDIVRTLTAIHSKAPSAKIVLMGYPPLLSDNGSCLRVGIGTAQLGLSADSANWLNETAGTLATAMQGAVDDVKKQGVLAWFSNPTNDFAGKAVCGNPEQVNGIVKTLTTSDDPIKDWTILNTYGLSAQSFHPKIGGARLYANSLERTMTGMGL
ncbi:SGNH/GDSL hydrolase family protein [Streptomyces sp. NPDC001002]